MERSILELENQRLRSENHLLHERIHLLEHAHGSSTSQLQKALFEIANLASSADDLSIFYQKIHAIIGNLMYAENFFIATHDPEQDVVHFVYFVDTVDNFMPNQLPMERLRRSLTAYVMRTLQPLHSSRDDINLLIQTGEVDSIGSDSVDWLGIPLLQNDRVLGVLVVQSYLEHIRFSQEDQRLLVFVSQHISTAIERKWARVELEKHVEARTHELRSANQILQQEIRERQRAESLQSALFRIAELVNEAPDMETFFQKLHEIIGELLFAKNFFIALLNRESQILTFPYRVDEYDHSSSSRPVSSGFTDHVILQGKPLLVDSQETRERLEREFQIRERGTPSHCWLGVPLISGNDILGALTVQSYDCQFSYSERDVDLLTFVSRHIAVALERKSAAESLRHAHDELERRVAERTLELSEANRTLELQIDQRKRMEEQLLHDAFHDALTGLPNRLLFMDRLSQALKRNVRDPEHSVAVLFLDLDRFKIINDSLGHMMGDELLKDVSRRVSLCLRSSDTVARLGGDEFAILLENIEGVTHAKEVAIRIGDKLDLPFQLANHQVFTSTSIGIAMGDLRYRKPEEMLRDADAAMYRAKSMGRKRFALFDESMYHEAVAMLELENDLRRGIDNGEFEVYYQPIVILESGKIAGFEALARWMHPRRGLVQPKDFIKQAEESGLIIELDWIIFRLSCAQLRLWRETFPDFNSLIISINLSSKNFSNSNLVERVSNMLSEFKLPPSCLKIEVTEAALLDNMQTVRDALAGLSAMDIHLSLDDFGTGYSSLSYLHRYPMDSLKIDRSFVGDMDLIHESRAIVKTIKALASSLDMAVIAEGIETREQLDTLRRLGCEYGQGFYFSPPVPVEVATDMLRKELLLRRRHSPPQPPIEKEADPGQAGDMVR